MRGLAAELKKDFGFRLVKLPLDGGFSCPNRLEGGCLFCSERGSGEFTRPGPIKDQLAYQKARLGSGARGYIAYFQNFSGTYEKPSYLRRVYDEALLDPEVLALAIATRVDCLGEEVLEILEELNRRTYLWVELGLQTTSRSIMEAMKLGYQPQDYVRAMGELRKRNIRVVSHMIIGLPGSGLEDELETARVILREKSWGLKIHSLYVQKNTGLAKLYKRGLFEVISFDEYIKRALKVIDYLGDRVVLHRISGDPPKGELIAPLWCLDKRRVLGTLQKELARLERSRYDK